MVAVTKKQVANLKEQLKQREKQLKNAETKRAHVQKAADKSPAKPDFKKKKLDEVDKNVAQATAAVKKATANLAQARVRRHQEIQGEVSHDLDAYFQSHKLNADTFKSLMSYVGEYGSAFEKMGQFSAMFKKDKASGTYTRLDQYGDDEYSQGIQDAQTFLDTFDANDKKDSSFFDAANLFSQESTIQKIINAGITEQFEQYGITDISSGKNFIKSLIAARRHEEEKKVDDKGDNLDDPAVAGAESVADKEEKKLAELAGSTAQNQVAGQIQQDLVGYLPVGELNEDGSPERGKTSTIGGAVPSGVAMATNPFVGKPSTGNTYGDLSHAQVAGGVRVGTSDNPEGKTKTLLNDFMEGRHGTNFTYPTVRPAYMIPGENDMAMSAYEQLRGDVEFDLFSVVKDGFGLGATNTLHVDNKQNELTVRYKDKLYEPRAWYGHELGIVPPRKEVQAVMNNKTIQEGPARAKRLLHDQMKYVRTLPGGASSQFLPDDNVTQKSSTGLRTNRPSPLLSHIDTHYYWQRQYDPAGVHMQNRKFRKLYDPLRQPQRRSVLQSGLAAHTQTTRRHPITYGVY